MVAVRKRKLAEDDLGGALERVTTSSRIENGGAENCEGYCLYEYLIIGIVGTRKMWTDNVDFVLLFYIEK